MALTDNIVAYYKLDSNSNDSTANGYNGTDSNISYSNAGVVSNCATFNGSSSKILLGTTRLIQNTYSISMWVYRDNNTRNNEALYRDWETGKYNALAEFIGTTLYIESGDGAGNQDYSGVTVSDQGAWIHLVFTRNGTTKVNRIYKNGNSTPIKEYTSLYSGGATGNNTGLGISAGDIVYFSGRVDEAGIWNRELSTAEIAELYNSGAGLTYPFTTAAAFVPKITFF